MNLCTYYCLCGFMIGVHLYILYVQWFYAACSLALRWPWGSSLCPCWPQDWLIVLFSWWSCQHNSSIRMKNQECTCLRYWGCITLALHSLQADINLAIWFWKSVTLAALGASVIASLELYIGEVVFMCPGSWENPQFHLRLADVCSVAVIPPGLFLSTVIPFNLPLLCNFIPQMFSKLSCVLDLYKLPSSPGLFSSTLKLSSSICLWCIFISLFWFCGVMLSVLL